ncbi:HD-GYP domain-containing protein [Leekyejoonella antrihumi]|uniref:HD domain-containing protein n=1 Tax=Leekyejoonella antrihumi TaxID=1660198 RepID=A0A563DYA5_9MICO|nr:HD domain-containing phosphohydrolase [Leekyejoonella antrihumi]TWP35258.1 HD domain-containing protein [Leekyejoonella antrihumi]
MPDELQRRHTSWGDRFGHPTRFFDGAWAYVVTLAVALGALLAALLLQDPRLPSWQIVGPLAVLAVLGEWNRLVVRHGSTNVSLTSVMLAASVALAGPLGAAIVGAAAHGLVPVRRAPVARAFNTVMTGLLGLAGGLVYVGCGGRVLAHHQLDELGLFLHCLLPLVVSTVAIFLLNVLCVGGMLSITTGASLGQSLRSMISLVWLSYLWYGLVGFLFAVLWGPARLGVVSVLVMVAPLLLAQSSLAQRNAEREVHQRTIESLIAAVEARDPIMHGHSARVAAAAGVIGDELRLSPRRAEALQFAALLHDIGLVGPRPRSAAGQHHLSTAERQRIRQHPDRGVEMLREIDFLAESVAAIRHHHERWDGHGFPSGLAGDEIPLLARIIAVADAYCALITPRLDRDTMSQQATLTAIRARAGGQFDPACVDALVAGQQRVQRVTQDLLGTADAPIVAGLDHDLPEISDQMAFGSAARA